MHTEGVPCGDARNEKSYDDCQHIGAAIASEYNKAEENLNDGYVYGQSVRGADAEFKEWVLGGGYFSEKYAKKQREDRRAMVERAKDMIRHPAYVWTNEHIRAHFTTCFTALVLVRLLETKLGNRYPTGQILSSIRKYNCVQIDSNIYQFLYYNDILEECGKVIQTDLHNKYRNRIQIRRMLRY